MCKKYIFLSLFLGLFLCIGCTPSSITPISNANQKNYTGKAQLLIAVEGTDGRAVRHVEIYTDEEPLGYEIYFHDKKVSHGLIAITLPTPSTHVRIKEYSLTGYYGCSRGKAGYGSGSTTIAKVTQNNTYFLGTINTSMNTTYNEMPTTLIEEAKSKYHYITEDKKMKNHSNLFKSHIKP